MKLYMTAWDDDDPAAYSRRFHGTQAEWKAFDRDLRKRGLEIVNSIEVEVPTDKAGLLKFLNEFKVTPPDPE